MMNPPSIATAALDIYKLSLELQNMRTTKKVDATSETLSRVLQHLGRYRVWSENIGAHRQGRVSLDYRLRDAAIMRKTIMTFLNDLKESIQQGKIQSVTLGCSHASVLTKLISAKVMDIVSGSRLPYDELFGQEYANGEMDDQGELKACLTGTEMEMLRDGIAQIIDHLYGFTIHIRSIARPRDLQRKAAAIDVSHFERYDIQHVRQIFRAADEELVNRLGKANTKRRQIFKYLEIHHWKLAKPNEILPEQPSRQPSAPQVLDYAGTTGVVSMTKETLNTQTTVTTVAEDDLQIEVDDVNSEVTSALSEGSGTEEVRNLPDVPSEGLDKKAFECPYCFEVIRVSGTMSWRTHIIRDLQPYICTFGNCLQSSLMFSSRREWFAHELEFHRDTAPDEPDKYQYPSKNDLNQFYGGQRSPGLDDVPAMIRFRPVLEGRRVKSKCPLCLREEVTIRSHLSRHLQTIATFSLPRMSSGNLDGRASDRAVEWDSQADSHSLGEDSDLGGDEEAEEEIDEGGEHNDQTPSATSSTQMEVGHAGGRWIDFDLNSLQQGQTPLINAASSGNASLVRWLLAEPHTNVEVRDIRDQTPLSRAAEVGASEVVELLITVSGIDINTRDRIFKRTPLNWAAGNGHASVVHILLKCPTIDLNVGDIYRRSPVWRASSAGHAEVVRELVSHPEVNLNAADRYGRTPIAWASAGNHIEVMRILAVRGVDFAYVDSEGVAPLARAAISDSVEAVKFLLTCPDVVVNHQDTTGKTALMRAVEGGHLQVVILLLEAEGNILAQDQNGKDALMLATEENHVDIVRLLIRSGANLDTTDSLGQTALMVAAQQGYGVLLLMLLKAGGDTNARDSLGHTALHSAAQMGRTDIVRLLLEAGGDTDAKDSLGQTALHSAAQMGRTDIVQLLLEAGADQASVDNEGRNAAQYAALFGHEALNRLLLDSETN